MTAAKTKMRENTQKQQETFAGGRGVDTFLL